MRNPKFKPKPRKTKLPPVKLLSSEWFILHFFKKWTKNDLRMAISQNVDLSQLILDNPISARPLMAIARSSKNHVEINAGNILFWLANRRPDLYEAVTESEEGVQWIITNMNNLITLL